MSRNGKVVEHYTKDSDGNWWLSVHVLGYEGWREVTRVELLMKPSFVTEYEAREADVDRKRKEFKDSLPDDYIIGPEIEVRVERRKRKERLKTSLKEKQAFVDALDSADTDEAMLRVFEEYGLEVPVMGSSVFGED